MKAKSGYVALYVINDTMNIVFTSYVPIPLNYINRLC